MEFFFQFVVGGLHVEAKAGGNVPEAADSDREDKRDPEGGSLGSETRGWPAEYQKHEFFAP